MSLFDYDWYDFTLTLGQEIYRLRAAEKFSRKENVRGGALPFGSSLWPAALVLGEALSEAPELLRDKRVLELGCGLGLCALVASRAGARSVLATDGHPDMPELFRHNAFGNSADVAYAPFDWAEESGPGAFDVVLASDVLYEPAACNSLARALAHTLEPGGLGVVCDPGRPHAPRFVQKLENRGFAVRETRRALSPALRDDPALRHVLDQHPTTGRQHHMYWITHMEAARAHAS